MLIGNTAQEGNLFLSSIPAVALPFVAKLIHLDVKKGPGRYKQRACDALTEHIYVRPQLEILKEYRGSGWRYVYNHVPSDSPMGCFHASELPVLFGLNMLGIDGTGDKTGKTMRGIWARFAKEGVPGWDEGAAQVIL